MSARDDYLRARDALIAVREIPEGRSLALALYDALGPDGSHGAVVAETARADAFLKAFNPLQPRGPGGQWVVGGGGQSQKPPPKKRRRHRRPHAPRRVRDAIRRLLGPDLHVVDGGSTRVREYLAELERLPTRVAQRLRELNAQVYLGNRPVTEQGGLGPLLTDPPSGWPPGSTWTQAGAVAIPNGVGNRPPTVAAGSGLNGSIAPVLHEIGHIVGSNVEFAPGRGSLDESPEWRAIWAAQAPRLQPYFREGAGAHETFAETVAATLTNERLARAEFGDAAVNWVRRWL